MFNIIDLLWVRLREGKKALYHCNYCNKDLTGKIRIKCAMCPDFDLCIECFSVGAEVTPHKSNHLYRIMVRRITLNWSSLETLLKCKVMRRTWVLSSSFSTFSFALLFCFSFFISCWPYYDSRFMILNVNCCALMLFLFLFEQDNLSFTLICPDWNADEEILLLEVDFVLKPYCMFSASFWVCTLCCSAFCIWYPT